MSKRKRKLRVEPPPQGEHYPWGSWAYYAHDLDRMEDKRDELQKKLDSLHMYDRENRYYIESDLRRINENIERCTADMIERQLDLSKGFVQVGYMGKCIYPRLPTLEEVHLRVEHRKRFEFSDYEEDVRIPCYISPVEEREPTTYDEGGVRFEDYPYYWDGSNLLQMGFNMLGQHFWYPVKLHAHVLRAILHGSWLAVTPKSHWLPLDAPKKWD